MSRTARNSTPHRRRVPATRRKLTAAGAAAALVGAASGALLLANASTASAASVPAVATGDTRSVSQPSVPGTVCATLTSGLQMASRTSSTANETTPPDTSRIQAALDACKQSGSGQVAVKLVAADSTHTAFLTGPLTVHQGEVLLLDSGVALYGSLNPANYQISGKPTCGTVASGSDGCKPLITVSGANAGVEAVRASSGSQGRIDGRGDLDILGTSTTWWDLATEAKNDGGNHVTNVLFENNTLSGTDSSGNASSSADGIRIKSSAANGGTVKQITYDATCLTKVKYPLVFDTHYSDGTCSYTPTSPTSW